MPTVDKDRFPKFIIQIPEEEFPDKLKIVVTGRETFAGADAKKQQLAAEARSLAVGAAGQPLTAPYFTKTYEEGDFKKTINGKKTAELKTPYDEISLIVGYAHREDPEDETPVNVNIFTTYRLYHLISQVILMELHILRLKTQNKVDKKERDKNEEILC